MAPLRLALVEIATLLLSFLFCLTSAIQITGLSGGVDPVSGSRPFRTEISQFSQSGAAFDLYILALSRLQATDPSDLLSFFQIAGIHGYPEAPWDGVSGKGTYPGFCAHACVVFPTWHRPYVALIEQALGNVAIQIANTYPSNLRNQYVAAAQTFRVPFMDWAAHPFLPDAVTQPTVRVTTPTGAETIPNPLYNYTFQTSTASFIPSSHPMSGFPASVRHWDSSLGRSDEAAATAALQANGPTILSLTYQLFTTISDYTTFSCTFPAGRNNPSNNIENIHNSIHNSIGGWGFMTFPEVSAFDPIFFLHHANVDRLFAMWQILHPNQYVVPTINAYGSYYEIPGTIDSGNSSLAPFHSDSGTTLYTSDGVRSTRAFGYTYPEIVDWGVTTDFLRQSVRRQVNALYNPPGSRHRHKYGKNRNAKKATCKVDSFSDVSFELAKDLEVNNLERQWSIHISVKRFAIRNNFEINFFMGQPPADPATWTTAPNLIGTHAQFIAANISTRALIRANGAQLRGEVSLSHNVAAAISRGIIPDPSPDSVVPVLQEGLNWRARMADGCEVDLSLLAGLKISVSSRSLTPAKDDTEFPTYGKLEWHAEATEGKPGGATRKHRSMD